MLLFSLMRLDLCIVCICVFFDEFEVSFFFVGALKIPFLFLTNGVS